MLSGKGFFLAPHASVSTEVDPFNPNSFIEKTGNMKGTVGDMMSLSEELSEKRAAQSKDGKDPVKEKTLQKNIPRKEKAQNIPTHSKNLKIVELRLTILLIKGWVASQYPSKCHLLS